MDNVNLFVGNKKITISEAMQKIDMNSFGILFLVNDDNTLCGCITDGDIRRFLLAGNKMDSNAFDAANKQPHVARSVDEARKMHHLRNYVVIPILNSNHHPFRKVPPDILRM